MLNYYIIILPIFIKYIKQSHLYLIRTENEFLNWFKYGQPSLH